MAKKKKNTKKTVWENKATPKDLEMLRADLDRLTLKEINEDEFRQKYPFSSGSGWSIIKGDSPTSVTHWQVDFHPVTDSYKTVSLQITASTYQRLCTLCDQYTSSGVQKRYVQDYVLSKALDEFGV